MSAGFKPSLFYPEDRSNTFLWNPAIYLPNYTESHPRRPWSPQMHLPSLKMEEESFSKIMCFQHKAQIFTIRALLKWNLLKCCSGQGGRDHQASQWHTREWNHCTTRHRCLCLIWTSDLSAQDQKRAAVLQLVSLGCRHQSMAAFTAFIPTPRAILQCVKLHSSIKCEYISGKSSCMQKRQFCCSTIWIPRVSCAVLCNVTFILLHRVARSRLTHFELEYCAGAIACRGWHEADR